jgi:hypothetical protein
LENAFVEGNLIVAGFQVPVKAKVF